MSSDAEREIEVRALGEHDVASLIACLRRCYGESYSEPEFYDEQRITRELRAGTLIGAVALVDGHVVGHIGTRLPNAGEPVAETVCGIVDPAYRGQHLTHRIGSRLVSEYRPRGIRAVRHVATGAHDRTQLPLVASGAVATGVLLGHLPASTDYRGIPHAFGDARIGVVVYVQVYEQLDALHVHLPEAFAGPVRDLYGRLTLDRRVHVGDRSNEHGEAPLPAGTVHHDAERGISFFRFGARSSADGEPATALLGRELLRCHAVSYADVPIADPRAPRLIDLLDQHDFFFGALLPGTHATECIRMQRLIGANVAPDAVVTTSSDGRALLDWIRDGYEHHAPSDDAGTPARGAADA